MLKILFKGLELRVVAVAIVISVGRLDKLANLKIVLAVLVPQDVTTCNSRLGKVIYEQLLL